MKTNRKIILTLMIIVSMSVVFGQGLPHAMYGTAVCSDEPVNLNNGLVSAKAYIEDSTLDTLFYSESEDNFLMDESGYWYVQLAAFGEYADGQNFTVEFYEVSSGNGIFVSETIDVSTTSQNLGDAEICWGIDDKEIQKPQMQISTYPNPFNSEVEIDLGISGNFIVEITDIMGNSLYSEKYQNQCTFRWHPDEKTASGIFFLNVRDLTNEDTETIKLIYQK